MNIRSLLPGLGFCCTVILSLLAALLGPESPLARSLCALFALTPAAWALWIQRRTNSEPDDAQLEQLRERCRQQLSELEQEATERQELRAVLLKDFESRTQELEAREHHLAGRLARFQEFLEYPIEDLHAGRSPQELQALSEQDRAVRQLLETEAERVYEKIRGNGYTSNGEVDLLMIRNEALELVRKVALIYRPNSQTPLADVSLEQLARAASRIWLHLLVLLEQLPLQVQQYSIPTLYTWIRRAVISYGVYQKASPWLTIAARGISAGRLVAGANPAVLGAWWLASELGRRGAKKWIEQTVDRQAVGLLRQVISIVGIEAAGIFGTGFRQRDPAWVLGTELVELVAAFPPSGESLRHGLTAITALPLLTEYDRIYLYRCLAAHRSAGLQLADPAMLTREQREPIANTLEAFFREHIHGATEAAVRKWRDAVESRLDLRLQLDSSRQSLPASLQTDRLQAASSLLTFLNDPMQLTAEPLQSAWNSLQLTNMLSATERTALLQNQSSSPQSFAPPDLDPASEVTDLFLRDLMVCVTAAEPSEPLEQLALETAHYFRRTQADARKWLDEAWRIRLRWICAQPELATQLPFEAARVLIELREGQERLMFFYPHLTRVIGQNHSELPGAILVGLEQPDQTGRKLIAIQPGNHTPLWTVAAPFRIERVSGVFVDDARLTDGRWHDQPANDRSSNLQISGSLRGGRYAVWFEPLLKWATNPQT
ncbi:MAG: hypothetical protein RLZZ458_2470 [Planctomycetota bacterium]